MRLRGVGIVALAVMSMLFTAACGSSSSGDSEAGSTAPASSGGSGDGMKVGFVYVSPLPGSAFSRSWDDTRKDLEQKYGAQTTVVQPIAENPDVVGVLQDLVRKGNKLIFATAFGYQPFVAQVAQQNPDVNFVVTGPWAQKQPRPKNVSSVKGDVWPVSYLTGIVAAHMSKTKVLGFVSAFSIPSVVSEVNGFEQGAKSVDPSIKTKVILTNTWYDPPKTTQASETLAKNGADVIAKHVDDNGPCLGAKAAGVFCIGSHADTTAQTPDTYLTGYIYDWRPYAQKKYEQTKSGSFTNEEQTGDIKSGLVKLGPINANVPASVKEQVLAAEKQLKSGELTVFEGPITSNDGELKLPKGQTWVEAADVYKNMTFFQSGVIGKVSE